MASKLTALELLKKQNVQCRTCNRILQAAEVVVTEKARRDPDDPNEIKTGRTAQVTARCQRCIEETTTSILL